MPQTIIPMSLRSMSDVIWKMFLFFTNRTNTVNTFWFGRIEGQGTGTCHTGAVRGYFVPSDKLHDAVDTNGTVSQLINENICRVHVFKGNAVGSVVELGPTAPVCLRATRAVLVNMVFRTAICFAVQKGLLTTLWEIDSPSSSNTSIMTVIDCSSVSRKR